MKQHSPEIREAAARWLARLERGLRPEEGPALHEWLSDPRQRNCILTAARVYHAPEVMAVLAELYPHEARKLAKRQHRPFLNILFVSALTLCVVTVSLSAINGQNLWEFWRHPLAAAEQLYARHTYATGVGETREIGLPDGSAMTLTSNTRAIVSYYPRWRDVSLPFGEATFRVSRQADRPFTVLAGGEKFRSAGGCFELRVLGPDHVELTVGEGAVKVLDESESRQATPALARLRDNAVGDDTTVSAPASVLLESGLAFPEVKRAARGSCLASR